MMYNTRLWKLQLKKKLGDKMDVPIFMMMCGLPASGKSTKAQELAKEYNLGFEYNDFFMPDILDSKDKLNDIVESYKKYDLPQFSTMHGDFFDVIPFSIDSKIREISDLRIRQSLDVARRMKVKAVVFHTNYNPFLNTKQYIESWIKQNTEYWNSILEENQDVNIYLENIYAKLF